MSASVSVIVPCYGYGHYVRGCVESILAQDGVDLDILVVDDASPDGSWDVVQQLPELDARVRVTRHSMNLGLIRTLNEGIDGAAGRFIVALSADDLLAPGALQRATDALADHPEAAFAYGPVRHLVDDEVPTPRLGGHRPPRIVPGDEWIRQCARMGRNPVWSPEVVVRASAQRAAGGYSDGLPRTSDFEMWLRLATLGSVVVLTGPTHAFYRRHPQNMSRGDDMNDLTNLEFMMDAFESWYAVVGRSFPEGGRLLCSAKATLARQALVRASRALDRRDGLLVEPLLSFALAADTSVRNTAGYRALRLRKRLGPRVLGVVFSPPAVAVARRTREITRQWRGLDRLPEREPRS